MPFCSPISPRSKLQLKKLTNRRNWGGGGVSHATPPTPLGTPRDPSLQWFHKKNRRRYYHPQSHKLLFYLIFSKIIHNLSRNETVVGIIFSPSIFLGWGKYSWGSILFGSSFLSQNCLLMIEPFEMIVFFLPFFFLCVLYPLTWSSRAPQGIPSTIPPPWIKNTLSAMGFESDERCRKFIHRRNISRNSLQYNTIFCQNGALLASQLCRVPHISISILRRLRDSINNNPMPPICAKKYK